MREDDEVPEAASVDATILGNRVREGRLQPSGIGWRMLESMEHERQLLETICELSGSIAAPVDLEGNRRPLGEPGGWHPPLLVDLIGDCSQYEAASRCDEVVDGSVVERLQDALHAFLLGSMLDFFSATRMVDGEPTDVARAVCRISCTKDRGWKYVTPYRMTHKDRQECSTRGWDSYYEALSTAIQNARDLPSEYSRTDLTTETLRAHEKAADAEALKAARTMMQHMARLAYQLPQEVSDTASQHSRLSATSSRSTSRQYMSGFIAQLLWEVRRPEPVADVFNTLTRGHEAAAARGAAGPADQYGHPVVDRALYDEMFAQVSLQHLSSHVDQYPLISRIIDCREMLPESDDVGDQWAELRRIWQDNTQQRCGMNRLWWPDAEYDDVMAMILVGVELSLNPTMIWATSGYWTVLWELYCVERDRRALFTDIENAPQPETAEAINQATAPDAGTDRRRRRRPRNPRTVHEARLQELSSVFAESTSSAISQLLEVSQSRHGAVLEATFDLVRRTVATVDEAVELQRRSLRAVEQGTKLQAMKLLHEGGALSEQEWYTYLREFAQGIGGLPSAVCSQQQSSSSNSPYTPEQHVGATRSARSPASTPSHYPTGVSMTASTPHSGSDELRGLTCPAPPPRRTSGRARQRSTRLQNGVSDED